ncbi:MAG TPA: hypothetical protein VMA77_13340 [Solirubrobacteraceae bacterium]|nr:hypothetical protein [Solirubrobacteraceae bacterium]
MGDDVVQLARDPGAFAAGDMLEQISRGGLAGGVVPKRLSLRALGDAGQRRGRRQRGQQQHDHAGFGCHRHGPGQRQHEEGERQAHRDQLGRGPWPGRASQPVEEHELSDGAGDGQRVKQDHRGRGGANRGDRRWFSRQQRPRDGRGQGDQA